MQADVLSRVMLLRQTLLQSSDAEAAQDLLQQANVLMRMLLQHEVSIDFSGTGRENTLLGKVAELVQMGSAIRDAALKARVAGHLQSIMSGCLSMCMCSACAKPTGGDAMSAHDKLQHVRARLLASLQA